MKIHIRNLSYLGSVCVLFLADLWKKKTPKERVRRKLIKY